MAIDSYKKGLLVSTNSPYKGARDTPYARPQQL